MQLQPLQRTQRAANQIGFIDRVSPHIEQSLIASGVAAADAAKQAQTIALVAANKITGAGSAGTGAELMSVVASSPLGNLAARTLDVPYEALAPFLEHDAYRVLNTYKRSIEPQLALQEVTGHSSYAAFRDAVMYPERDRIKTALMDSIQNASPGEKKVLEQKLAGFDNEWTANEKHVETLFESVLGRSKMTENAGTVTAQAGRITRKGVGMVMLSGQVLSSLVDIPRQVMAHGLTPVMGAWGNYLTSGAFRNMSKESAERVGVALELTANKLKTHGDFAFGGYEREMAGFARGGLEAGVDYAAEKFQWLNGAMLWNDTIRSTTAALAEDRLLRASVTGWSKLSKMDKEWMLVLGIDEKALNAIGAAQKGNTQTTRRFMHTDVDSWTDLDAMRDFRLAVLKDASTTAMTPFRGTLPAWYDSEAGKFLWQFKSFMSASYQQTMMVGMQRADARVLMGAVAAIATGMTIAEIKTAFSASKPKERDMLERVRDGVDRSGIADMPVALAAYGNAAVASLTGKSIFSEDSNKRPQGLLDAALGPTGSVLKGVGRASEETYKNGFNEKAQQQLMSVTPFHKITRFNTTLQSLEVYNDAALAWVPAGQGATGAVGNPVFYENDKVVTGDYTIASGKNAGSFGPISINTGVTVTVSTGATWSIV